MLGSILTDIALEVGAVTTIVVGLGTVTRTRLGRLVLEWFWRSFVLPIREHFAERRVDELRRDVGPIVREAVEPLALRLDAHTSEEERLVESLRSEIGGKVDLLTTKVTNLEQMGARAIEKGEVA